ncbi:MAG: hypothetical protein AAF513_02615 [Pseudomonadota bacterium]
MRKFAIALGLTLLGTYSYLAWIGVPPKDQRPGTRLAGLAAPLPSDLSFTNDLQEVYLQTHPWYGIPFSVTTVIVHHGGHLYIPSLYDSPQAFPGTKYWNRVVAANPEVRLLAGERIFDLTIAPVLDETEFNAVFNALGRKFPFWREQIELDGRLPRFALLRLTART